MSYEARREEAIAEAVDLINADTAVPVDLLAELDQLGVNINWLFKEAASLTFDLSSKQGALK